MSGNGLNGCRSARVFTLGVNLATWRVMRRRIFDAPTISSSAAARNLPIPAR
jgi:hypothetical protein